MMVVLATEIESKENRPKVNNKNTSLEVFLNQIKNP